MVSLSSPSRSLQCPAPARPASRAARAGGGGRRWAAVLLMHLGQALPLEAALPLFGGGGLGDGLREEGQAEQQ